MIGIVIVAHGGLAREYLLAMEHVVGVQGSVHTVAIHEWHDRSTKEREICRAADEVDTGDGVVIVTDIFGASPSNLALTACQPTNRRILYGMNLPMLLKLAKCRGMAVPDAARLAIEAGRKYIDTHNFSGN